nr:60s ribosomal subunit assembly/export protein loc1 [Quercus suber]
MKLKWKPEVRELDDAGAGGSNGSLRFASGMTLALAAQVAPPGWCVEGTFSLNFIATLHFHIHFRKKKISTTRIMAPVRGKAPSGKGAAKRSGKPSTASSKKPSSSKPGAKAKPTQQKTKSAKSLTTTKKKPPHMRYTEKELKVPQLNGIRPTGIQKAPNVKKGKNFVDDKESMNAILAMVMADKEGNIESKMMRARQLEEVREARKAEMEKRAESKKAGLEDRKRDIKDSKKKRQNDEGNAAAGAIEQDAKRKKDGGKFKPRKRGICRDADCYISSFQACAFLLMGSKAKGA